jgi:ketosteroid isomerase-like protein
MPARRRPRVSTVLALLTIVAAAASRPAPAADAAASPLDTTQYALTATRTVRALEALEKAANDAYRANDLDRYFSYYWDDCLFFYPDGRTDLATYRRDWTKLVAGGGGIVRLDWSELKIALDETGDAAVASYRVDVTTRDASGKEVRERFQETDVWFRRRGTWKMAFLHYSPDGTPTP